MQILPKIILKLDDAGFEGQQVHTGWQQTIQFLDQLRISSSIGVIGRSLESPSAVYVAWLKDCVSAGHEVWNHGFHHSRPEAAHPADGRKGAEFRGMDLAYQFGSLQRTQELLQKRLGVTATTFGAPFNATDDVTVEAIRQIPELSIWLFKETSFETDCLVLPRIDPVNIEYPVHVPDFDLFKEGFERHLDKDVLVIQGHPRSWAEEPVRFDAFCKIIQYLVDHDATFTTPRQYADAV